MNRFNRCALTIVLALLSINAKGAHASSATKDARAWGYTTGAWGSSACNISFKSPDGHTIGAYSIQFEDTDAEHAAYLQGLDDFDANLLTAGTYACEVPKQFKALFVNMTRH